MAIPSWCVTIQCWFHLWHCPSHYHVRLANAKNLEVLGLHHATQPAIVKVSSFSPNWKSAKSFQIFPCQKGTQKSFDETFFILLQKLSSHLWRTWVSFWAAKAIISKSSSSRTLVDKLQMQSEEKNWISITIFIMFPKSRCIFSSCSSSPSELDKNPFCS